MKLEFPISERTFRKVKWGYWFDVGPKNVPDDCWKQGSFFPPHSWGGRVFQFPPQTPPEWGGNKNFPPDPSRVGGEIDLENLIQKGLFTRAPQAKILGDWWGGISAPQAKIWTILNL